jgi:hypothetical protein
VKIKQFKEPFHVILALVHTCFMNFLLCFVREAKEQKSEKDIAKEMGAVIRQITASVSFLPLLESSCETKRNAF